VIGQGELAKSAGSESNSCEQLLVLIMLIIMYTLGW
jgi:hypothetical protein